MASSTIRVPMRTDQVIASSIHGVQMIEDIISQNHEAVIIQQDSMNEWNVKNGLGNGANSFEPSLNGHDEHHEDYGDDVDDNEPLEEMSDVNSAKSDEYCFLCKNETSSPRLLSCLHVFCEECINTQLIDNSGDSIGPFIITCPVCEQETRVGAKGAASLACDYVLTNILDMSAIENMTVLCTSCKTLENAVARCSDCANFLCPNCNTAHQFMRCFEGHKVIGFEELRRNGGTVPIHRPLFCQFHPAEHMKFYCYTCQEPICNECLLIQHKAPDHQYERLIVAASPEKEEIIHLMAETKSKKSECEGASSQLQNTLNELQTQRDQAKDLINETLQSYKAILEKARDNALKELQKLHSDRELKVMETFHNVEKTAEKIGHAHRFTSRLLQHGDMTEILASKRYVSKQLMNLLTNAPKLNVKYSIEFQTDYQNFEKVMQESFGKFKTESSESDQVFKPVDIPQDISSGMNSMCDDSHMSLHNAQNHQNHQMKLPNQMPEDFSSMSHAINHLQTFVKLAHTLGSREMNTSVSNGTGAMGLGGMPSSGVEGQNLGGLSADAQLNGGYQSLSNSTSPVLSSGDDFKGDLFSMMGGGRDTHGNGSYNNPRGTSKSKQTPMQIRCKFGQLGPTQGQFNSPHGFCLGADEDIIVADTNNHRIQIFDKNGQFKSQFGIPGKEEGQLWYPRKVAVMRNCGKFVVCDRGNERSRMQIFTKNGHFIKKIAIRYIDIVAGLAVNRQGHIVAVDSVSPTVFVISDTGNLLNWFDCSDYMREPSDIAIHGKEFYVCDFKGHCVVVFNDEGHFLRRIGGENITNFPNGIDISDAGDIVIGDSHGNRFHLAVFSRDGSLISEFECPYVKVSRCCGLKITSEGYIVTLAKNNHHVLILNTLYIL